MERQLPPPVIKVINELESCGFSGYIVGGCVRDYLLGKTPMDFDMTTDASPKEVMECFKNHRVIETGIAHGTVTVVLDGLPIEITTHRTESDYSDKRHPDTVTFSKNISDDLSRRDFTMNAMAYHPRHGLIDLYGGAKDIKDKVIRCVGDPNQRLNEDALRILRGLRFASDLGFEIEENTRLAIFDYRELLKLISVERINVELTRLLCGKNAKVVLLNWVAVIGVMIPELLPMVVLIRKRPITAMMCSPIQPFPLKT